MTTKPRLAEDANYPAGMAAVALFLVLGAVFVTASFGDPAGFPSDASVTASLGYALFNIGADAAKTTLVESESFLAAFEIVDVVLVAALVGSITLARKETGGEV